MPPLIKVTKDKKLYVIGLRIRHGPPGAFIAIVGACVMAVGLRCFIDDLHDYPWSLRDSILEPE